MGRFTNPRDLYFGEGARHEVKNLKGKKAIIVSGGSSMRRGGFLQDVEADLKEAGMEVKLFEGVESDPSIETVMKGAEAMREFEPDWIIAIGGGSPIDAGKAMWVFYEYPEESFDNIIQPFSFPELRQKAHFCAISSTSGTATEVTAFSVITDYAKGIKYPLADYNITPDIAIVDPELAETMPKKLTAHTGMDAMTHAIEAYVSTVANDYTDPLALPATDMIHDELVHSASQAWRSPTRCSALFTPWHIRPALHSPAATSSTAVQTRCTCRRSFATTQRTRELQSAMRRSQTTSASAAAPLQRRLTSSSRSFAT